jgi:hypothetical protein
MPDAERRDARWFGWKESGALTCVMNKIRWMLFKKNWRDWRKDHSGLGLSVGLHDGAPNQLASRPHLWSVFSAMYLPKMWRTAKRTRIFGISQAQ